MSVVEFSKLADGLETEESVMDWGVVDDSERSEFEEVHAGRKINIRAPRAFQLGCSRLTQEFGGVICRRDLVASSPGKAPDTEERSQ